MEFDEAMTDEQPNDRISNQRSIVLIVLVGMIAYFNSFGGAFVFDDGYTIVNNEKVNDITFERLKLGRPFIGFVNALNHLADGSNPRGYHLVNLAAHILASLTLFGLVRRTLLLERWPERVRDASRPLALGIAVLWMVHPLQTASVTYIIQRCESMMGMFYLLTMYCFVRGATSKRPFYWYMASIFSGLLGSASKEVIVTAPIVILVYDWVFLAPRPWKLLIKRGWYYALLAGVIALSFIYWSGKMAVAGGNVVALGFDYKWYSSWEYLMSQSHVILHYIRLAFWPDILSLDYQDWAAIKTWRDCWLQGSVLSAAVLFSLVAIFLRWWIGFAIFAFFAIVAPTSSIMPIQDLIFDHRMYLSLAPLICLVIGVGWHISRLLVDRGDFPARAMSAIRCLVVTGLVIALSVATMFRNDDYRSRESIWSDVVKKRPNCVRALTEVASQKYNPGTADEARELIKRSVELYPNYADARYYYGVMLFDENQLDAAAEHFNYASRLHPEAWIYPRMEGLCYLAAGYTNWAVTAFRTALKNMPTDNWTKMLLGLALLENYKTEEAEVIFAELRAAWRDQNDSTWVLALQEARQNAYRDDPNPAQKRMAILYAKGGILITEEKNLVLLDILAAACAVSGQFQEAEEAVKKAIALAEAKQDKTAIKLLKFRLSRYQQHKPLAFGASR